MFLMRTKGYFWGLYWKSPLAILIGGRKVTKWSQSPHQSEHLKGTLGDACIWPGPYYRDLFTVGTFLTFRDPIGIMSSFTSFSSASTLVKGCQLSLETRYIWTNILFFAPILNSHRRELWFRVCVVDSLTRLQDVQFMAIDLKNKFELLWVFELPR